ncbi:MAG: tRNA (guanine-N(1)-)-methyltransferase, partial [Candidatus Kaiserbacteria bacterium GW2011_GWC2_52_8b]
MIHFHIITLFPESIEPYLSSSILGRAQGKSGKPKKNEKPKICVSFYDPKDFVVTKHKRVDQRPYGGGPGMVLEPTAILKAVEKALRGKKGATKIFFATDGVQFDERMAKQLARKKAIVLICGRYEGVDARVQKILKAKKVSVGPYVLTGGELPAVTLIDAVSRFVPGVLGKAESLEASRVASPVTYTRPEVLTWKGKKYRVPKVLLS